MLKECRFCKYFRYVCNDEGYCYKHMITKDVILESLLVGTDLYDTIETSVDKSLDEFDEDYIISHEVVMEVADEVHEDIVNWLECNIKDVPSKKYLWESCNSFE